jgi:hypothetical protein
LGWLQRLLPSGDGSEDAIGVGGPHEELRLGVVLGDRDFVRNIAEVTMRRALIAMIVLLLAGFAVGPDPSTAAAVQRSRISVRTESYPRPPYSGATHYIYERDGEVICTKLQVCNKYDQCDTEYKKGSYKAEEDVETGDPYGKTGAVFISSSKLKKHVCLTRFKLR